MGAIAWSIVGALIEVAGTLVGKVLISLGIGYASYSAVDTSINWAKDAFFSNVYALPPVAIQVIGVLKVGQCVNMLVSALIARLTLNGMNSGTVKKMVQK